MNHRTLITLCLVAPLAWALPIANLEAKPAGKKHKSNPPAPEQPDPASLSPSQQLAPYVNHIDGLLAFQRPAGPATPLFDEASGHLAVLRATFAARRVKAEAPEAASLAAAVATCDALSAALDERQRTLAQISSNSAVAGGSDLGRQRKDNFSQGTTGQEFVRTLDVIEQAKRERARNKELKQRAAQTDNAFKQADINRWKQRAVELRQQIATLYARIG